MAFAHHFVTPEEYLTLEGGAETKSEYFDGQIFAMAGASPSHSRITANLTRELDTLLLDGPCVTYSSDLRVKVDITGLYTYPDVVIVCGPPDFEPGVLDTLTNPSLLIEVLSPSTEAFDRGAKFAHYRRLPSLREYWLVSQDRARIERYQRQGDLWQLTELDGLEAAVSTSITPGAIPMDRIYNRVELPERPAR